MDYGCEMQLLQDGAQLQLQLQPEEFVAIADYTATDETQVPVIAPQAVTYGEIHFHKIKPDLRMTAHFLA